MALQNGRLISLALAALLGGGLMACDSSSSKDDEVAQEAEAQDEGTTEEQVEINVEDLPFYATGPVARVNGTEIEAEAFNKVVQERTEQLPGQLPAQMIEMFKSQTLDFVIDKHLVDGVLAGEDIEITDEDVDKAFDELKARFPDESVFEGYLTQLGMSADEVKESMRQDVELEKYLSTRYDLEVSEEEAQAFFDENTARFARAEEVRARHILIQVEQGADEATANEALTRAQAVYEEASADGADFEALARQHSEGPTASNGGDLGFFSRERMVPQFSEVAFAMEEPGQVSEPVRTQFGYHIIQFVERRDAEEPNFENAKEEISLQLRHQQRAEAFQEFLGKLKEEASIERMPENIEDNAAEQQAPAMPNIPQLQLEQGSGGGGAAPQLQLDPSLQQE